MSEYRDRSRTFSKTFLIEEIALVRYIIEESKGKEVSISGNTIKLSGKETEIEYTFKNFPNNFLTNLKTIIDGQQQRSNNKAGTL